MHRLQAGHAEAWLALHMQQNYLTRHGGRSPHFKQIENRMNAMAAVDTTRPAPYGAITTYRAITGVTNLLAGLAAWNDARSTRKALSRLTDRELDDIGLCRGDIDHIGR